jgi:hypothetical protein
MPEAVRDKSRQKIVRRDSTGTTEPVPPAQNTRHNVAVLGSLRRLSRGSAQPCHREGIAHQSDVGTRPAMEALEGERVVTGKATGDER